ncbi:rhamnogalacturonan acetylesterase [Flavobacterium aquariorum]|uniref:Rhamnogalacturonan acetylesterase n=1 Tax=Flavobacterium aquariorum TaxID=2217670 RepID=A0A2W7TSX5_9FLAO|nr:rhamnogalacturonan acetylesterase [Flavobacterium aquariorum]PZX92704.1 rhamnogalacturonan acetylesterase [Flavobacterium aquariorum]
MKHFKSIFLFLCMTHFFCANAQDNAPIKEFTFGGNTDKKSGTLINKAVAYTNAIGYGFDLQSDKNVTFGEKSISAKSPFYFSMKLPEGNYSVEVVLDGNNSGITTVKAESRRLMLREIKTAAKETKTTRFVVNVRNPKFDVNSTIKLKPAELKGLNWDDKLTLEFLGTSIVQSIKIYPISKIKTIYVAGDSTVMEHDSEPWASWTQFFPNYLTTDVVIANYACSGLTLRSFTSGYRLDKILYLMEPGDYLFIEFGHNDEKATGDGKEASGVYTALLKDLITKTRNKGGSPILITPIQRRYFNPNGTLKPTHGEFPDAMRKVAQEMQVPLIDLTKMTTSLYQSWGNELSKKAFVYYPDNTFPGQIGALVDNTHFNNFGANEVARCIVQNIKNTGLDLFKNIKPTVPHYIFKNPSKPSDWTVPMSARIEVTKPDGE